jgi:polyferredoxin
VRRLEVALAGLFAACWCAVVAHRLGLLDFSDTLRLSLYHVYGTAAVISWVAGNVFVERRRSLPRPEHRRRALVLWLVGPLGIPSLLWAMAPADWQAMAPLVPLLVVGVGAVFFAVPLVFGGKRF